MKYISQLQTSAVIKIKYPKKTRRKLSLYLLSSIFFFSACQLPTQFERVKEIQSPQWSGTSCTKEPCIAIVTHSTLDVNYASLARDNHMRYAKKHGYAYVFRNNLITEDFLDPQATDKGYQLGLYWQKLEAVHQALANPQYKWVVWMDIDAIFTNFDKTLEDIINTHAGSVNNPKLDFLITEDPLTEVNSGVFFVFNGDWGRQFIKGIKHRKSYENYRNCTVYEQGVVQDWLWGYFSVDEAEVVHSTPKELRTYRLDELNPKAKIVSQRVFNSLYKGWWPFTDKKGANWQKEDLIAHMAVTTRGYFREYSKKHDAIKHLLDCFKNKGGENYENGQEYKTCE